MSQTMTAEQIERECIRELTVRTAFAPVSVVVIPRDGAVSWEVARVILRDGSNAISENLREWLAYGRPVIQDLQRSLVMKKEAGRTPAMAVAAE